MNREQKAAIIAVMIPCLVYAGAIYQVYVSQIEHETTFKVFMVDYWEPNKITQILTWGDSLYGKYQFIGNWSGQFELDHSYHVVFVQKRGSTGHPWNNLIILEWSEVI